MVSTTAVTSGSLRITSMLLTNSAASGWDEKSRMSQMYFTVTGWPARRPMLAALRRSTSSTPLPTVP